MNKMSEKEQNDFHRNLNTVLLTVISVFGVFSVVLLINVNNKMNSVIKEQAVQQNKIERIEKDIEELKQIDYETDQRNNNPLFSDSGRAENVSL